MATRWSFHVCLKSSLTCTLMRPIYTTALFLLLFCCMLFSYESAEQTSARPDHAIHTWPWMRKTWLRGPHLSKLSSLRLSLGNIKAQLNLRHINWWKTKSNYAGFLIGRAFHSSCFWVRFQYWASMPSYARRREYFPSQKR